MCKYQVVHVDNVIWCQGVDISAVRRMMRLLKHCTARTQPLDELTDMSSLSYINIMRKCQNLLRIIVNCVPPYELGNQFARGGREKTTGVEDVPLFRPTSDVIRRTCSISCPELWTQDWSEYDKGFVSKDSYLWASNLDPCAYCSFLLSGARLGVGLRASLLTVECSAVALVITQTPCEDGDVCSSPVCFFKLFRCFTIGS